MADTKRLAFSIIQFLHDQLSSGSLSSDAQESLEGKTLVLESVLDTVMLLLGNSLLFILFFYP